MAIADWASTQDAFIAKVCKFMPNMRHEPYRAVPPERSYHVPPPGLKKHYDDRGHEEVHLGRYKHPILFDRHFVPLARAVASAKWQV